MEMEAGAGTGWRSSDKTLPDVVGLACTHKFINKILYMLKKNLYKNKHIFSSAIIDPAN